MRLILVILDSLGMGSLPRAQHSIAHTFARACEAAGPLQLRALEKLGVGALDVRNELSCPRRGALGAHGLCVPSSLETDSLTRHLEIFGAKKIPKFEVRGVVLNELVLSALHDGELPVSMFAGMCDGQAAIDQLGSAHSEEGKPIVYISKAGTIQVAGLDRRVEVDDLASFASLLRQKLPGSVARVIARQFTALSGRFSFLPWRREYAASHNQNHILDELNDAGLITLGLGKVAELLGPERFTSTYLGDDRYVGKELLDLVRAGRGDFIAANFNELDSLYGHRRNAVGYGRHLEEIDRHLCELLDSLLPGDRVVITADHGNDPGVDGWHGHTDEFVPILIAQHGVSQGPYLGILDSLGVVANEVRAYLLDEGLGLASLWPIDGMSHHGV